MQRDIKAAKAEDYFSGKVEECAGDSGKLWRRLGTLGCKAPKGGGGIALESDGKSYFDPQSVSELNNRFYTSVASSLVDLPLRPKRPKRLKKTPNLGDATSQ